MWPPSFVNRSEVSGETLSSRKHVDSMIFEGLKVEEPYEEEGPRGDGQLDALVYYAFSEPSGCSCSGSTLARSVGGLVQF